MIKMILLKSYYLIFFIAFITSCKDNSTEVIMWEDALKLEPNTKIEKLRLDQLFEVDKTIALETSNDIVIGQISKIILNKDRIYLLDMKRSKSVFVFTHEGKFVKRIRRSDAKNPFKPFDMSDICYSEKTGELLVLDNGKNKVFIYDSDGNDLNKSLSVDFDTHAIACLLNGNVVGKNYNLEGSKSPLLYEIVRDGDVSVGFKHFVNIKDKKLFRDDHYFFNIFSNNTLFLDQYNDTIFNIIPNVGLEPKRIINFGKSKIPSTFYNSNEEFPTFYHKQTSSSYSFRVLFYFENDKHIFFPFLMDRSLIHYHLDKTTMVNRSINLGLEEGLLAIPVGFYAEGLILYFESYDLLNKKESAYPFKNKHLLSQIEKAISELSITQEDNQILVFLSLKTNE